MAKSSKKSFKESVADYAALSERIGRRQFAPVYLLMGEEPYFIDMLAERLGRCVAVGGKFPRFFDPIKGNYRYIRLFINSTNEAPQLELSKFAVYKKGE